MKNKPGIRHPSHASVDMIITNNDNNNNNKSTSREALSVTALVTSYSNHTP